MRHSIMQLRVRLLRLVFVYTIQMLCQYGQDNISFELNKKYSFYLDKNKQLF